MLFLILLSTSLGVWATIDMLSPDEKSDSSDDENASEANETTQAESQTSSSSNNSAMSSQNLQLANQSTNTTTTETSASTFILLMKDWAVRTISYGWMIKIMRLVITIF